MEKRYTFLELQDKSVQELNEIKDEMLEKLSAWNYKKNKIISSILYIQDKMKEEDAG
jgi:hypothetical protein